MVRRVWKHMQSCGHCRPVVCITSKLNLESSIDIDFAAACIVDSGTYSSSQPVLCSTLPWFALQAPQTPRSEVEIMLLVVKAALSRKRRVTPGAVVGTRHLLLSQSVEVDAMR